MEIVGNTALEDPTAQLIESVTILGLFKPKCKIT